MDKIEKIKAGFAYLDDLEEADLIWEFIRRSSEYQKACEAYIADRAYCSQTIDDPELGMIYIFQIIFLPFGLYQYVDPNRRAIDQDESSGEFPRDSLVATRHGTPCYSPGNSEGGLLQWQSVHDQKISVWIDPTGRAKDIAKELKAIIKRVQEKDELAKAQNKTRRRLKEWRGYLKCYDMHQDGFNNYDITEVVYAPKGHKRYIPHPSDCTYCDTTEKNVNRAKELVEGEYKKYNLSKMIPLATALDDLSRYQMSMDFAMQLYENTEDAKHLLDIWQSILPAIPKKENVSSYMPTIWEFILDRNPARGKQHNSDKS